MDAFFKFYGTDWALFFFVTIHLWLLGHQKRSAFLFAVMANFCGFSFGLLSGSTATILMNIFFCFLNVRAYFLWRRFEHRIRSGNDEQI